MTKRTLSESQRNFFALASQAIFANPFTDERLAIDAKLAGQPGKSTRSEFDQQVSPRLRQMWASLGEDIKFTDFEGKDADLLMHAMLFDTFWHYSGDLDKLILEQIEAGDETLPVPFAPKVLTRLRQWGFSPEQARRFFAMCFQIRRAYFFIDRDLPGPSASMQRLRQRLWVNIFTDDIELYENHLWCRMEDFSTFLLGETGTGKGTAASALGRSGWIPFDEENKRFAESFTQLFVPINLSQFTESLIESELFGHVKGAFTGAVKDHQGVFERCHRYGAIFLDEIGEVSIPVQIKLLNVLQERVFSPVGSHKLMRFGGRVIAATNRSVHQQREDGTFRDDFFYRLCSDIIEMPTLRQRIEEDPRELEILIDHIVRRTIGQQNENLSGRVMEVIATHLGGEYPWRGNVRELEQCVRRVILTGRYTPDPKLDLERETSGDGQGWVPEMVDSGWTLQELTARYCAELYEQLGTYEAVAAALDIDRRTVKKYVDLDDV